jgi:HK97 family phage prohead protease
MTELEVNLDGKEIAERVSEIQRDENGLLCRSFSAEMSAGDGRTIDVRIVPYGVPAEVSDDGRTSYREMWMPGAFSDQARGAQAGRASHVMVNFRHGGTFGDVIGHGVSLVERDDAFYGSFKILDGPDGDKALELVRAEALSKVSLEAFAKKTARTAEGIVQRIKGHLVNIALTPQGAYDAAAVLAIRETHVAEVAAKVASLDMDTETVERLKRAGISLPERYDQTAEAEAHPAGHPADGGTPDEQHPPTDVNSEAKGD